MQSERAIDSIGAYSGGAMERSIQVKSAPVSPQLQPSFRYEKQFCDHAKMVEAMLIDIGSETHDLSPSIRNRMRHGVLRLHYQEWIDLRRRHSSRTLIRSIDGNKNVVRWPIACPDVADLSTDGVLAVCLCEKTRTKAEAATGICKLVVFFRWE